MDNLHVVLRKVFPLTIVFALLAAGACFSEEIKLSTIMPHQDTLSVTRGAIGAAYKDMPDEDVVEDGIVVGKGIGESNLLVQGKVGIGTVDPGTNKLKIEGGTTEVAGGLIIETRTDDPAAPKTGRIWLRTDF